MNAAHANTHLSIYELFDVATLDRRITAGIDSTTGGRRHYGAVFFTVDGARVEGRGETISSQIELAAPKNDGGVRESAAAVEVSRKVSPPRNDLPTSVDLNVAVREGRKNERNNDSECRELWPTSVAIRCLHAKVAHHAILAPLRRETLRVAVLPRPVRDLA